MSKSKQAKLLAAQQLAAEQLHQSNVVLCHTLLAELVHSTVDRYEAERQLQREIQTCTSNAVQYIVDVIDYSTRERIDIGETNSDLWRCEPPPTRCPIDSWAKNYIHQIPTVTG